jgi:HAD superfamily phosphoserine phosphatase-like hydrolase
MKIINTIHFILTKTYIIRVLTKLFPKASINKRLILLQLYGLSFETLNGLALEYYNECIKPSLIHSLLNELEKMKIEEGKIWIVSGGYDIYLKYFVREFGLDGYLSSRIKFSAKNKCLGRMSGLDCLGKNKVILLKKYIPMSKTDLASSYAFSDSKTDLPLLKYVGTGVVVSKSLSQKWVSINNLKEIIWK